MAKYGKTKPKRTPKAPAKAKGVPVCIAALYCDSAIIGEDKTITIIRTIDTIIFPNDAELKPGTPMELSGPMRLVIMLKRDDATGRHEMPVTMTAPSGKADHLAVIVQDFSGDADPEAGYNAVNPVRFIWRGEGLYWLQVRSRTGKVIARTALRLRIASQQGKK